MTSALLPSAAFADETDPQATEIVTESDTAAESVIVEETDTEDLVSESSAGEEPVEFTASAVNEIQTVMPGDRVLLETEASAQGPLTYQWYHQVYYQENDTFDWLPVDGATGETFVIEAANQDNIGSYRCDVTEVDTGSTQQLLFDVFYPDHFLNAKDKATGYDWSSLEVKPNAPLKLEVEIDTLDMATVSCQWRVEYYDYEHSRVTETIELPGAASNVLDISAVKASGDYVCHVEDVFGDEQEIRYNVTVVTGLKAYDKKTKEDFLVLEPAPGESVTMTAAGTTDIGAAVKYQWTRQEIEYESEDIGTQILVDIPGATSASYTVKKPMWEVYTCVVTDGYRNYKKVIYIIQVQNELEVWIKNPKSGNTTIYVPYNGSVTLEVGAKAKTGKLHYEWATTEYGEFGDYGNESKYTKKVSNRAEYTLKNVKTMTSCYCTVTDDYGGSSGLDFIVYVDTGLKAYAAGTQKTKADISVVPKCNAQLSVDASAKTSKTLLYRWYIWRNAWTDADGNWNESQWVPVNGAAAKTYTVSKVTQNQKYRCLVFDGYGGVKIVTFNVKKTSEFTDAANEKAYYYEPVYWAVENGITVGAGGNGKFSPNEACTREQIVTFLWRLMGEPEPQKIEPFADVKADAWYAKPISWAYEQGITTGLNDGTGRFGVGQPCKREMCVTFLYRAAGKPAVQGSNSFTDMAEGAYYVDAVTWAVNNGITTGLNDGTGRFGVGQTCTRAMIVTFLYRYAHMGE